MICLPSLRPSKRVLDEDGVLVAVADDQALRVAMDRQRREELGLAAALQAEVKFAAGVEDFLDHLAQAG